MLAQRCSTSTAQVLGAPHLAASHTRCSMSQPMLPASMQRLQCRPGEPSLALSAAWRLQPQQHARTPQPCRAQQQPQQAPLGEEPAAAPSSVLVGEDAAVFSVEAQTTRSWVLFTVLLSSVLAALYVVWIRPDGGLADDYVASVEALTHANPEATILAILGFFGVVHSGLAGLRPKAEELVGARAYRVLFALVSLPLAAVAVMYFINHRYEGTPLWDVRGVPGVHSLVWALNFISFYFLYPSTFNLLEVAAVDKPKLHMWETGIMRISRHPQAVGQAIWCFAHTLWIGNSFMVTTSLGLMAHHLFGCWHGDRRLKDKYGDAFEQVKARTSTFPFQAIWEGRQQLPADYYKEFLRVPYAAVTAFTLGAYFAHPLMQQAAYWLDW